MLTQEIEIMVAWEIFNQCGVNWITGSYISKGQTVLINLVNQFA